MLDHLKSLGGSPYLNGASWDPSKFNISRIIEAEPYYGVLILLDYDLQTDFTPDGYNKTERILALIKEGIDSTDEGEMGTVRHFKEMLVDMEDLHEGNSTYRDDIEAKIDVAVGNLQKYRDVSFKPGHWFEFRSLTFCQLCVSHLRAPSHFGMTSFMDKR